ncbi:MAG: hypothetical protein ACRC46_13535 [Thermoguttaceae bacterium]
MLVLFVVTSVGTAAPVGPDEGIGVDVGIGGYYKNGAWTPVFLDGIADDAPIEMVASDPDGVDVVFTANANNANELKNSRRIGYVKLGRARGSLTLRGERLDVTIAPNEPFGKGAPPSPQRPRRFTQPVPNERPIYLVVGGDENDVDPFGLADAVALLRLPEHRRPVIARVRSLDELPDEWRGYDAISMVFLAATPDVFAGRKGSSPQVRAIANWVELGGKLVLLAGAESGVLCKGDDAPLASLLPGKYERMTMLRHSEPIALLAGSNRPLVMTGSSESPFVRLPYFTQPRGVVMAQESDLVIASRSAFGIGTITYFGGDLDAAPLRTWRDRPTLLLRLLGWNDVRQNSTTTQQTLIQLGYSDISGQMRSALDARHKIVNVPFSLILLMMCGYLLVIGVGDYLLVHKVFRRPQLTWLTFPLAIAIFAVGAYWLGVGNNPLHIDIQQVSLVDIDTTSQTVRETVWASAYSPRDALYNVPMVTSGVESFGDSSADNVEKYWCWFGLTGSGLGGMNPKTVTPRLWSEAYRVDGAKLLGVPMAVRSTKSFGGVAAQIDCVSSMLKPTLTEEQAIPIGTFCNPLDVTLHDAILIYGRWVITLGDVAPKATVAVTSHLSRCEPRELLYRMNVADVLRATSSAPKIARYNPQSRDCGSIVRAIGFYQWFGGYDSIGLYSEHQAILDMSELLKTDRGVVVAGADVVNNESIDFTNETFVRIVVPVTIPARIVAAEASNADDPLRARDNTHAAPE